jgi:hypothetical protein
MPRIQYFSSQILIPNVVESAAVRLFDTVSLVDRYDHGGWVMNLASSIVSLLKSPPLKPTDEEIEAQAIRDGEYSRREAERILTREAEERRVVEEKILAIRSNARTNSKEALVLQD